MKKIALNSAELVPTEKDEEPGMPSFRVDGSMDGVPFKGVLSLEIDGRDVDYEQKEGPDPTGPENADEASALYCLVQESDAWRAAVKEWEAGL